MPSGARSLAALLASPIIAALVAAYADMLGAPPTPAIDAAHTTDPPLPAATIAAVTTDSTVNAPRRLTSMTARASAMG